jgi:hypothetical protein
LKIMVLHVLSNAFEKSLSDKNLAVELQTWCLWNELDITCLGIPCLVLSKRFFTFW